MKFMKFDQSLEQLSIPYPIYVFKEKVWSVITTMTRVLGLESDKIISDVVIGFLVSIFPTNGGQVLQFKYDEFMANRIHEQFGNFNTLKCFRC